MVNIFRRFQQPLLIALTILVIVAFVVLYNLPSTRGTGTASASSVGSIYGRSITQTEVDRAGRRFQVAGALQLSELQPLLGEAQTENQQLNNFVFHSIVLRHEAEKLGVMSRDPGDAERAAISAQVAERIKTMPAFQNNGVFDYSRYEMLVKLMLGPSGMTERDLEDVIADGIRVTKVKEIVGSTVSATPAEVREFYADRDGKLQTSVVRWKLADFKAAATVTEEEVKKLFEDRKATLNTPEKRSVKYVAMTIKSDKPLFGREKASAMRPLAEQAQAFALAMASQGADFNALVEKAKTGVGDKGEVKTGETPAFEAGIAPPELDGSETAAMAAFKLTKEEPNSDVITGQKGYYVLQLANVEPSRPLTYEEAKAQLETQLKDEKAQEAMSLKANEARTKIDAELKAGKPFEEAAKAAGLTAEKLAPFSPSAPLKEVADAGSIMGRSMQLAEGELSEFVPSADGGLLVHLDQKLPLDEAAFEKEKASLTSNLQEAKREAVFRDWLRVRTKAADMKLYRRSMQMGS